MVYFVRTLPFLATVIHGWSQISRLHIRPVHHADSPKRIQSKNLFIARAVPPEEKYNGNNNLLEGIIENAVRSVGLGDETYKFGDITKNVTQELTKTTEDAVRTVTNNDDYVFGDISKGVVSEVTKTAKDVAKTVTKNEEYQWGDITKVFLSTGEKRMSTLKEESITKMLDENFSDLPVLVTERLLRDLTDQQRRLVQIQVLQVLALAILTLNLMMNICTGCNIVAAWAVSSLQTGSPLASAAHWRSFIAMVGSIQLFTAPVVMPAQCGATFFLTLRYMRTVLSLQKRLPGRNKSPIMHRFLSIFLAFLFGNCLSVAAFTGIGIFVVSLVSGVPLR